MRAPAGKLRRLVLVLPSAFAAVLACAAPAPKPSPAPAPPVVLPGADEPAPTLRLPQSAIPLSANLSLSLDPNAPGFSGEATLRVRLPAPRAVIWMHGRGLTVTRSTATDGLGEVAGTFAQVDSDGMAKLTLPRAVGPGEITLSFAWTAKWGEDLQGVYLGKSGGESYVASQNEELGARRILPCFDEPQLKIPWAVQLTVPAQHVAVTNAMESKEEALEGGKKRITFNPTPPLPTYLLAFAVGPYDVVTTESPPNEIRKVPLRVRGLAPKGRGAELAWSLQAANELLPILEKWMGIPYPYDKLDHIAVPDFEAGAMENPGAIIYRETALLYTKGKSPRSREQRIADTIAHEMAHLWFGDYVTLPWWTDTWLNESFATWMATHAMTSWRPELRVELSQLSGSLFAMQGDGLSEARAIRQPVLRTGDIRAQFDGLTYQKGAAALEMFERWLGPEKFRAGVQAYLRAHPHGTGSTDDLFAALSEAGGRDVGGPFRTFLDQAGVPLVQAKVSCEGGAAKLLLTQQRYFPVGSTGDAKAQTWRVPVCARFGTGVGNQAGEACTLLEGAAGEIPLGAGCPAWVMPNAGAAGYYRWTLAPDDLKKLVSAGLPALDAREKLSFARSLSAAMRANTLSVADALVALEPLAKDPDLDVATDPLELLGLVRRQLVPAALKPRVEEQVRALYRPLLAKLGWSQQEGEEPVVSDVRPQVIAALAETGRDPEVRKELARLGLAYANVKGNTFDSAAVNPSLAGAALNVAVEDGDDALFDLLAARLDTETAAETRGRLLGALWMARDPARVAKALTLSQSPKLRRNERGGAASLLRRDETRAQAWEFISANFDAMVKALPEGAQNRMYGMASAFCEKDGLEKARALLAPKAAQKPGADRSLARATESANLCIALKDAQSASATAYYAAREPKPAAKAGPAAKPAKKR
jgi:alanyl aminopeptidase